MSLLAFPVKTIHWSIYEHRTPILLQEENGPCPLIALVNTLLLASDIEGHSVSGVLPGSAQLSNLGTLEHTRDSVLLEGPPESPTEPSAGARVRPNTHRLRLLVELCAGRLLEAGAVLAVLGDMLVQTPGIPPEQVDLLLHSLPLLHTGLDVDPILTSGTFPETALAAQLFAAFGLRLCHGWCKTPNHFTSRAGLIPDELAETLVDEVFAECPTFDSVQDHLFSIGDDVVHEAERFAVTGWLEANSTQLTADGLQWLGDNVPGDSVCVFFRNNHFSTMYRHLDGAFYLLLTDSSLETQPHVWQLLNSVSGGDDLFFSGDFTPVSEEADSLRVAQQLQAKEDSRYARQLLKASARPARGNSSRQERALPPTPVEIQQMAQERNRPADLKKTRKKLGCVVV